MGTVTPFDREHPRLDRLIVQARVGECYSDAMIYRILIYRLLVNGGMSDTIATQRTLG
jgi:hypothetical protein